MTMMNRHTLNRDNRHDGDAGVTGVTGSTGIPPRKCPDTDRTFVRPKKVQIYFNGDRNFKGKVVQINPHRYNNFEDLLDDLTAKLPADSSMSHGVRQVFTPVTGRRVKNLSQLEEGCKYVCAGFESFKPINYGFDRSQSDHAVNTNRKRESIEMLLDSRSELSASRLRDLRLHRKESTKHPSIRTVPNVSFSDHAFTKPKVITVFRCGAECPQPNIKILLNRQSVQTFEQFVKDVSDGFGYKARKHQLKKLFTLSGREVRGMSDMFRDDDIFIAVGNEDFNTTKLREVLNEIYQTNSHVEAMMKMWEKTNSKGSSRDVNWSLSERESVYQGFEREKPGNKEDKRLSRKSIDREVHNRNNDVKMKGFARDAWSEAEKVQTDEQKSCEDEEDLNPRKIRASVLNLKKKRAAHLERLAELERQSDWSEMETKLFEQNEKERIKQRQLELLEEVRQKKIETLEKKRKELEKLEKEREKKRREELLKQDEDEMTRTERIEQERKKQREIEKSEKERERQKEIERIEKEREKQREIERIEKEREKQREIERIKKEREKQREIEKIKKEKEKQREIERIEQEREKQREIEKVEKERVEQKRKRLLEKENEQRLKNEFLKKERELERQKELREREREEQRQLELLEKEKQRQAELRERAREEEKQTLMLDKKKQQQQQRLEVIRKARERGEAKIRERRRQQKRRLELLEKENEERLEILDKENEHIDSIEMEKKKELAGERDDNQDRLKPAKQKPSRLPMRRYSKPAAEHEDVKESTDASTGNHNEIIIDSSPADGPRDPVVDQVPNTNASTVLPSSKKSKPKVNKTSETDNGLNNRRMSLPPRNSTIVDEGQHYLVRPESVHACGSTIVENDEIQSEHPEQMKAADGPQEADPIDPAPVSMDPLTENNDVTESFNNQNKFPSFIEKTKFSRQISNIAYVEDRYDIGKTLGDGNFAVVKYCVEKTSKKTFALKIIDKLKLKGREMMIENEIDILKVCKHPNIVRLFEEFETDGEIYIVLEYVKGGDLFDMIANNSKFTEIESAAMAFDLAKGLFYLHSRSIVHRDIKPENILVHNNSDGTTSLKLADFGLATEVLTPLYLVCGTPTYVAPEILAGTGYGLEIDMWAFGVILYILLCGFPPFRSEDQNQTELFEYIKSGDFDFLSPYWDDISIGAKELISNLLIVNRTVRYTATDVLCDPFVVTCAGCSEHSDLDKLTTNLRRELDQQSTKNLANYRATKASGQR